jgi:uncharacterized membrane protein YkvA (DUF1232 family)
MATLRPSRWFTCSSGWRSCLRKSNPGRNGVAAFGCGRRLRYAKAFALAIAAYALSPIDLIPDFIPVFGYLDEVILLPLAIMLAVRLMPPDLMAEHRAAAARAEGKPVSRAGATFIVTVWLLTAGALIWWLWPHFAW